MDAVAEESNRKGGEKILKASREWLYPVIAIIIFVIGVMLMIGDYNLAAFAFLILGIGVGVGFLANKYHIYKHLDGDSEDSENEGEEI